MNASNGLPSARSAGGYLEAKLPLLDYPLTVTDLAAIGGRGHDPLL